MKVYIYTNERMKKRTNERKIYIYIAGIWSAGMPRSRGRACKHAHKLDPGCDPGQSARVSDAAHAALAAHATIYIYIYIYIYDGL